MSRGDDLGEAADLGEEHVGQLAEVKGVAEDRDAGLADHMAGGFLVALRVDEVAFAQAEYRAVGGELVQVGVRVAGGLLGLVLGVDDGTGEPRIFQTMSGRSVTIAAWSR